MRPLHIGRRPYNVYCVGGDVKPCSINQTPPYWIWVWGGVLQKCDLFVKMAQFGAYFSLHQKFYTSDGTFILAPPGYAPVFSCCVTSTVLWFLIVCHRKEVVCLFGEVFIRGLVPSSSIYVVLFHVADKQACHVTCDVITVVISISQHCVEQWLVSLQQTRH